MKNPTRYIFKINYKYSLKKVGSIVRSLRTSELQPPEVMVEAGKVEVHDGGLEGGGDLINLTP